MRHKPKPRKPLSVIQSRLSCVDRVTTCSVTRKAVPWSRRARLKHRIPKPDNLRKCITKRRPSFIRGLADLHLPFVEESSAKRGVCEETWFQQMRWAHGFSLTQSDQKLLWEKPGYEPEDESPLQYYEANDGPHWNLPPTCPVNGAIANYITHLHYTSWNSTAHLQIPASWPIFGGINWEQKILFDLALTGSSESKRKENLGYDRSDDSDYNSPTLHEAAIHCQPRAIIQPRKRRQYELLKAMHPRKFHWRHQTDARARRRDVNRHAGYLDCNQASHNQDIWPQTALTAFLGPLFSHSEVDYDYPFGELPESHKTGRLIINLVATDAFPSQSQEILQWPPQFVQGSQIPTIDYSCRSVDFSFGLHQKFYPVLYAAQYDRGDRVSAARQLAIAFQPMMTLFILYYLDTRTRRDEPMPSWMFLFGAVYNEAGFTLHTYHPVFRPPAQIRYESIGDWGWGAIQADINVGSYGVLASPAPRRSTPLVALNRVQGHCRHVLECLSKWNGYQQALDRLSDARSRY